MKLFFVSAVSALQVACAKPDPAPAPPAKAMDSAPTAEPALLRTHDEATQSIGKIVRVRGRFGQAKLGAMVETDAGLMVVCPDFVVGDVAIGASVTFEGRLELADYSANVGPGGVHSAGTEPGTKTWVLRDCQLR